MFDVIVVGARCAGSPLAMLLARQGARVLLLDRAKFPSDIPHGHFIHRNGPPRLQRWGLLEKIAAKVPAISSTTIDLGDFPLPIRSLTERGVAWGYGPRRTSLDKILVDAAVAGGAVVQERATIIIGADGRNSRLAKTVQAKRYNETPALLCYYFSYWSGVETDQFEFYARHQQHRVIFAFKTEDDLFAVFVGFPMAESAQLRADTESLFMAALDMTGDFGVRIRAGRREERFYGASDLPNFYRTPYGPGWALVGDAGLHKDPYLALGISDALRDAEELAGAVSDGLNGRRSMDQALADYEIRRNEASASDFRENILMAQFAPIHSDVLAVRARLRERPDEATRFWKSRVGMADSSGFSSP